MKILVTTLTVLIAMPAWATSPPPPRKPPVYVQEMKQKQQQRQYQRQQSVGTVHVEGDDVDPPAYAPGLSLTAHSCIGSVNGVLGAAGVFSGGVGWTKVHKEACAMEWALKCTAKIFLQLRGRTWVNRCIDAALSQAEWSAGLTDPRMKKVGNFDNSRQKSEWME